MDTRPNASSIRFTFDRRPMDPAERDAFAPDLAALGLDGRVLEALDGLVSTGTRDERPHLLRGYRGNRLAFVAHPIVCRRMMRTFFPNRLGEMLDVVPAPSVTWTRHDPAVDLCGSPGFVVAGEDREAWVAAAVDHLTRRHVSVAVLEEAGAPRHGRPVEIPMVDAGRHAVGPGVVEALFERRGNLRRKLAKFRNKGGVVEVVPGALTPDDRAGVLHCIACAQQGGLMRAPYQGNYTRMTDWATRGAVPGLVHVIARLDGAFAGYHAFLESGRHLLCLSGGFDRTRHTTYHAYENVLLEAMRHAERRGLSRICFGPVSNASKAAVMSEAAPMSVRVYSRWPPVRQLMRVVVPRSALRAEATAPFRGLSGAAPDAAAG